jgi:hypothetical protein
MSVENPIKYQEIIWEKSVEIPIKNQEIIQEIESGKSDKKLRNKLRKSVEISI